MRLPVLPESLLLGAYFPCATAVLIIAQLQHDVSSYLWMPIQFLWTGLTCSSQHKARSIAKVMNA